MQREKVGQTMTFVTTVKPVLSGHPKRRPNIGFQDHLLLGAAGSSLTGVTALWSLSKTHLS